MKVIYKEYSIEVVDDNNYTFNSTDNITHYDFEYPIDLGYKDRYYPSSQHGIRVSKDGMEIRSAILCETGGASGINENAFLIKDEAIFICCSDTVYSLAIPGLTLNWRKRLDPATCFGIYEFENDLIIHGELSITRIDKYGELKWEFGARDIFVTQDGRKAFEIKNNQIELIDWQGYKYLINSFGKEINQK